MESKNVLVNTIETLSSTLNKLGEGPHWDDKEKCIYFVDILGVKIGKIKHDSRIIQSAEIIQSGYKFVTLIVPMESRPNNFVVALDRHIYRLRWNPDTKEGVKNLEWLHSVDEDCPTNRFNDGKCDAAGRLWAGTMGCEDPRHPGQVEKGKGSLYRIDGRGCHKMLDNIDLSNGLDWSPDGKLFYFIDSLSDKVEAFDFDVKVGSISNRRVVFDWGAQGGYGLLDGMTVDNRGHLWIAVFDGGKVIEVLPSPTGGIGKVLGSLDLETMAKKVTSVAFGGEDCQDLIVTSARTGDPAALKDQDGALFIVRKLKSFLDGQICHGKPGRPFKYEGERKFSTC